MGTVMVEAHVPVMRDEVVALLTPAPAGTIVDATLGAGGHAEAIARARARAGGSVRLLGIDRDPDALALATTRLATVPGVSLTTAQVRFDRLAEVVDDLGMAPVAGVLLDLGVSSMHLDRPDRGFSYRREGPLDMRMGPDAPWIDGGTLFYLPPGFFEARPLRNDVGASWFVGAP